MSISGDSRRPSRTLRGAIIALSLAFVGTGLGTPAHAASEEPEIAKQPWSFSGVTGHYDRAQLQRGFQVYQEVCAACHGMRLLRYRNLGEPGGPEFSADAVKAIAAAVEVPDGPNDDGEMFERPGRPADAFRSPYANDNEARAVNGGALPPDLSVMAKARSIPTHAAFAPLGWARDIIAGYQEGGPDYLHALMTGYEDAPEGTEMAEGMHYNAAFAGHQIAMPSPLSEDLVDYTDGSPKTVDQYSRDVSAYLMWAAEPKLEERKRLGLRVLIYLIILAVLLYLTKRLIWSKLEH